MDEIRQRLMKCFQVVFPALPQEKISGASPETVAEWDSVAGLTLMNVIEDEFGVQIDLDDLAGLDSFERYRAYLEKRAASA